MISPGPAGHRYPVISLVFLGFVACGGDGSGAGQVPAGGGGQSQSPTGGVGGTSASGGTTGTPTSECGAYCEALCAAVVECGLDAADCRVGCAVETPELCNVLSIEPRTCQELIDEAGCYAVIGEGGDCEQGGLTAGLCRPGQGGLVGSCAGTCSAVTNTCEPCTASDQCGTRSTVGGERPHLCEEGRCVAVECLEDEDCTLASASMLCDAVTRTCTACMLNSDCRGAGSSCVDGRCHECTTDDDCFGSTPVCNTLVGACEACSPANCDLICDGIDGCVECTNNTHCTNGEACHTIDNVCGEACDLPGDCPEDHTCSLDICVPRSP